MNFTFPINVGVIWGVTNTLSIESGTMICFTNGLEKLHGELPVKQYGESMGRHNLITSYLNHTGNNDKTMVLVSIHCTTDSTIILPCLIWARSDIEGCN